MTGHGLQIITEITEVKKKTTLYTGVVEMVQWLKVAVIPEDLGSIPSTHIAAYNCL